MSRVLVSINGGTGCGKTTLARQLTRGEYRAVLVDPAGDEAWRASGFRTVRDLPDLSRLIAANWSRGFRYVIVPPAHLCAEALDRVSSLLFAYGEKLYRRETDGVTIIVDEMAECYSNAHALRRDLSGFRRVILQGRHVGISVYGITQRPAEVAAQFRDNAHRAYYLRLNDETSRARIIARLGKAHEAALRGLKPFEYLAEENGTITRGKTRR